MKKIFSLILITALLSLTLSGCASFYKNDYALMIGVSTSQNGSKITNTVAAIVIDKDYKIVSCRIDCIEVKAAIDEEGNIFAVDSNENKLEVIKSKVELGADYGMLNPYYGSTLAEWDDQAKTFESYVIGMTREEVKSIATTSGKATDEVLTAGCTIAVTDFMKAIDKAFASEHRVGLQTKDEITLGVSASAGVKLSGKDTASYTADFGAVAVVNGKVIAAVIDSKEVTSKITNGAFGDITDKGTKLEQGDSYGMVAYGNAIAEWYDQAQAFADTAVGKSPSEISGLATEGVAGCTVYAGGYKKALEKAASNVR